MHVHDIVLAKMNECFHNLILVVKLNVNCNVNEFKQFIKYIHTNQVDINQDNIMALTNLATEYQLFDLKLKCLSESEFMGENARKKRRMGIDVR